MPTLRRLPALAVLMTALFAAAAGATEAPAVPFTADKVHLGVSSCGGSSCHGALEPWDGSTVRQDEFIIWQEKDRHAKAYQTLLTEKSKRIAANLGLPNAYEAEICLDCHADNVPVQMRAKGFQIADGVGCESCHGGAENWLGIHVAGRSDHAANVAAGLYPTEEPVARAKLCLSCHFGDKDRFVTHRIMGAGHPRMAFELDTFTAVQPAHFDIDADYRSRKRTPDSVQVWAVGQVVAIDYLMDAMLDPTRNQDGIFPELVFFDCHACHHPMSNVRWEPREGHGIGPGIARLNDANMIMLGTMLDHVDAPLAATFRARVKALHQASLKGREATLEAVQGVKDVMAGLIDRIGAWSATPADMRALLAGVVDRGMKGDYVDYAAAEQATMALSAILDAMKEAQAVSAPQQAALMKALDQCYEAVAKDEAYNPRQFLAALQALEAAVPRS